MPFIYKPIRQFMSPNEQVIDPAENNTFSLIVNGQICTSYRFQIYDMQNNLISNASTEKTNTTMQYVIRSISIVQDTVITAASNLVNGQSIRFTTDGTLPAPLEENTIYYVGNFNIGMFNIFTSYEDAIANTNHVDITTEGIGHHSIIVEAVLYNGETLDIVLPADLLTAGNTYKWQVELFAMQLDVTDVDTSEYTLTIPNHNLVTGDTIYVFGDTLPSPLTEYTTYYVGKIDNNTIALFNYVEGARNDAGRIEITTAGTNVTVFNVAKSEQIVFDAYNMPVVTFESQTITSQSFTFKPEYVHPQGVMISNFIAYISSFEDNTLPEDSGVQENIKLEWTFDGLLSGNTYSVKFIITTKVGQVYETEWVQFPVEYSTADIGIVPEVTNNPELSSVDLGWSGIVQITGELQGNIDYLQNYGIEGNYGLELKDDTSVVFNNLNIQKGSMPPIFWWTPNSTGFTGPIMRCENTTTNEYIEIGYNGISFYRNINGIEFDNAPSTLNTDYVYFIGMTSDELLVRIIGNR